MIPLDEIRLPDHSRVWVYQADRVMSESEQAFILKEGANFTQSWAAHGNDLMAEVYILLHHFVIIVLDEQVEAASGCSIDKSMHFVQAMEKTLGLRLTNRLISGLWVNESVSLYRSTDIQSALHSGEISGDSLVFDNAIQTVNALKNNWLVPLRETWLKKYVEGQKV